MGCHSLVNPANYEQKRRNTLQDLQSSLAIVIKNARMHVSLPFPFARDHQYELNGR